MVQLIEEKIEATTPKMAKKSKAVAAEAMETEVVAVNEEAMETEAAAPVPSKKKQKRNKKVQSEDEVQDTEKVSKNGSPENKRKHVSGDNVPTKKSRKEHRIFIGNVDSKTSLETFKERMSSYGEMTDCFLPKKPNGDNKGFAFVAYDSEENMQKAVSQNKSLEIDGSILNIKKADDKPERATPKKVLPPNRMQHEFSVHVGKVAKTTKADDIESHFSQFGTVLSTFAPRTNDGKGIKGFAFINFDSQSGVDAALGNSSHKINGASVTVSARKAGNSDKPEKFSDDIFIGKIPSTSDKEALESYLSEFGEVKKLTMPFNTDKSCYKGFAFVSFKDAAGEKAMLEKTKHVFAGQSLVVRKDKPVKDAKQGEISYELYVGKIPVDTKKETVNTHFSQFGTVEKLSMPYDKATDKFKGFAFVKYTDEAGVREAMAAKSHMINGSPLTVRADKSFPAVQTSFPPKEVFKHEAFARGVDPHTAEDTLRKHFSKYGNIKNITLPKNKDNGLNKGFCFVAFSKSSGLEASMQEDHEIDGKMLSLAPAIKNETNEDKRESKVVKGKKQSADEEAASDEAEEEASDEADEEAEEEASDEADEETEESDDDDDEADEEAEADEESAV